MITVHLYGEPHATIARLDSLPGIIAMGDAPASAYTLDPDELAAWEDAQRIAAVRARIGETAGDSDTILGTVADAGQLLLFAHASLVLALSQAQTLKDVRDAAAPHAARAADFLAKIDDGRVILPFMLKGENATSDEIEARATAVAEAMIAVAYADPD